MPDIKTIMHLIASNFYGGPEKQIVEHLIRLNRNCYREVLVSFLDYDLPNEILEKGRLHGLRHYGIPMFGPIDFRVLYKLSQLIHSERVDLLCTHGYKSNVLGWCLGRKTKIPVLAFSRGYTEENRKIAFYEWLERCIMGRVDGVICVSWGQLRRLESYGIQCRRKWVVHNAVYIEPIGIDKKIVDIRKAIFGRFALPEGAKIVVSAGRLSPEKGHQVLVDAISHVVKKMDNLYFIFCGDGICKKDLEKRAENSGVLKQCRFPGFQRDIGNIFQSMELLVLPSLTEGLPNVVLEAFACAKPVVATAVGGVPEIVDHGINGLLVPPKRPDLLAKAIKNSLNNPSRLKEMGKAGYQKVKTEFTFEAQTQSLEAVYSQVIRKGKG